MSSKAQQKKPVVVEEDVDDLDDVLEQFNTSSTKPALSSAPTKTPVSTATPSSADAAANSTKQPTSEPLPKPKLGFDDLNLTDDFTAELAKGMAELMREIAAETSPAAGADAAGATEEDKIADQRFRQAWEEMLIGEMNGVAGMDDILGAGAGAGGAKGKEKAKGTEGQKPALPDDDFQASIRKAMEKLKESESNLQAESAAGGDDPLEALLKSFGEGGGESEEELQGILESMMTQLMSKEVLYEPLKELHDKFPAYMRDNAAKIKPDDKKRYEAQQALITQIITIFDSPNYSDEDATQGVKIVALMNEMQSQGSPPAEIMGPLPPGLDMGPDGLPKLPEGCTIM